MIERRPKTNEEIEAEWRRYIKMKSSWEKEGESND